MFPILWEPTYCAAVFACLAKDKIFFKISYLNDMHGVGCGPASLLLCSLHPTDAKAMNIGLKARRRNANTIGAFCSRLRSLLLGLAPRTVCAAIARISRNRRAL